MLFLVLSDDIEWCHRNLADQDVYFSRSLSSTNSATVEQDMALAGHCNHSIISFGTFSFWTAYLKPKGITIHPEGFWDLKLLPGIEADGITWKSLPDPCQIVIDVKVSIANLTKCQENS